MVILSDKQISSVVDRLNKCGVAACPVCGRKELKVSDKVFALSEYLPEGFFPIPLRGTSHSEQQSLHKFFLSFRWFVRLAGVFSF